MRREDMAWLIYQQVVKKRRRVAKAETLPGLRRR
jgi:hypothetical protein